MSESNAHSVDASRCPLCGGDNSCSALSHKTDCWCFQTNFPKEIFEPIPPEQRRKACICQSCVEVFNARRKTSQ